MWNMFSTHLKRKIIIREQLLIDVTKEIPREQLLIDVTKEIPIVSLKVAY